MAERTPAAHRLDRQRDVPHQVDAHRRHQPRAGHHLLPDRQPTAGPPEVKREEAAARAEALRLLDYVGLKGKSGIQASALPYGDQRRLEIARALGSKPRLLLLDEPTAGMNPSETGEMTQLIRSLRDDMGITVLLIEHEMRVVMGISDRITVLHYGERLAEGTAAEIQSDQRVIEAYLGRAKAAEVAEAADAAGATEASAETAPAAPDDTTDAGTPTAAGE